MLATVAAPSSKVSAHGLTSSRLPMIQTSGALLRSKSMRPSFSVLSLAQPSCGHFIANPARVENAQGWVGLEALCPMPLALTGDGAAADGDSVSRFRAN